MNQSLEFYWIVFFVWTNISGYLYEKPNNITKQLDSCKEKIPILCLSFSDIQNIADRNFSIYVPGVMADYTDFLSPRHTRNITWSIPKSAGPGSGDAECIAKASEERQSISV